MSLKRRIQTLEEQAGATAERDSRMVEMVWRWPGEEPRTILVPRGVPEMIVKIYGPKSPELPGGLTVDATA